MPDPFGRHDLAALIAATEGSESVLGRLWPGASDRTVPPAREWVRRWGPSRPPAELVLRTCGCSAGRCGVCN